jgi:flavin reductase (DIM6/NTAB) family NADH-FMN oxidoreductase RutF
MKKSLGAKTIIYPAPVWCVGTYDAADHPNVMTIAWGGICCSSPPCVTISLRKATYTYANLMQRKAFTLSVPSEKHVEAADYFGIATGRDENKFEKSGLTPVKSELVDAPYVKEFPMVLECNIIHHHKIGLHTHFIGEIADVKVEENMLGATGHPEIESIKPIIFSPTAQKYNGIGPTVGRAFSLGKRLM